MGVNDLDPGSLTAIYGRWEPRTPADAAALLEGYAGTWWIAGGWAIEAFTGVSRPHEDLDTGVLLSDVPLLRRHLAGQLHVWTATKGALAPLLPDDGPDLPAGCGNLWTRRDAEHLWELDFLIGPGSADEWVYRRDESLRMPMAEALWHRDGIAYLQPEVQLLYKAPGLRPKDQADLDATLPHLDGIRRAWLRDALARTLPGHPWIGVLG